MREVCHKGLAKLVGAYGSVSVKNEDLPELIKASIEPDLENRKNIEENLQNVPKVLPILFEWLVEHTIGAKEKAIINLRKSKNTHHKEDSSWISFLGYSFHFITDWGTLYHSPLSVANPVIPNTIVGTLTMVLLGVFANRKRGSKKMLESAIKWGLVGAGTSGGSNLIKLYLDHKIFEEQCDEYWIKYKSLIRRKFTSQQKIIHLPKDFEKVIILFDEKMNDLRIRCNMTSPDFILSNDGENFADYMAQIAVVMDFAIQIIKNY